MKRTKIITVTQRLAPAVILLLTLTAPAAAQQWASKMFKVNTHDFGSVARGAKTEFAFEFQNLYEEDVHVASVRSSCGCTSPRVAKSDLKTYEKSQIIARYNTGSFLGKKGATITVVFDRPTYAEVQLTVTGYIRSDVVFDPGEVSFGEVDQFDSTERKISVAYAGRSDWQIVDVRSANENFEVELAEQSRGGGRVTYDMLVRLKPDAPAGYFQDQLTIVTNDARLQRVPLRAQGRVVSPLTVSPNSLFLGVLNPGESVTKKLVVRGRKPFRVTKVKCADDCFEFIPPSDESKTLHLIPLTYTAAENGGSISQQIEIETDLGAIATCRATATVRERERAELAE